MLNLAIGETITRNEQIEGVDKVNEKYDLLLNRRSIRQYEEKPVHEDKIKAILEAAMAAPSAGGEQPWHFVAITEKHKLKEISEKHPYAKMLEQAPLCIVVCGDKSLTKFPNEGELYWIQDCSAATQNILLAAKSLDLGSVWIGVHPQEEREQMLRDILGIPENITPFAAIAIGYPAEHKDPAKRYDQNRVHREHW
ncbi:nitroreductase [Desulfitispora alkaliphila]|uniref:nitroreductase family protein n=1 Tax=Desulfitispora alkaliphila TaxID=622674 RepID=UPI003D1ADDCE